MKRFNDPIVLIKARLKQGRTATTLWLVMFFALLVGLIYEAGNKHEPWRQIGIVLCTVAFALDIYRKENRYFKSLAAEKGAKV